MRIAICPGSFDPVTNGHIDIFERAAAIFDRVLIGVFHNPNKKPLFTMEERVAFLKESTAHLSNIEIDGFSGLLSEYAQERNASIIVRGLRSTGDYEYEYQRAAMLKKLAPQIETVCIMSGIEYSYISSTGVKELAKFGGQIRGLVPACVELEFKKTYLMKDDITLLRR